MTTACLSRIAGIILVMVTLLLASCAVAPSEPTPKPKSYSAPPPVTADTSKQYAAIIETEKGNLVLELFTGHYGIKGEALMVLHCKTYDPVVWKLWVGVEHSDIPPLLQLSSISHYPNIASLSC